MTVCAAVALTEVFVAFKLSSGESEAGAFGPHYAGLQERRQAADVPTLAQADPRIHFHLKLSLFIGNDAVEVPANVGVDPAKSPVRTAALHTRDESGTVHVEGMRGATLGQFFRIWGVPFSERRLGPKRAGTDDAVQTWVNDRPSRAFGGLRLSPGQRIVVSFGKRGSPNPTG